MNGEACVSWRSGECGNAPPREWLLGWKRGSGATLTTTREPLLSAVSFSPRVMIWLTISFITGWVYCTMGILCCAILHCDAYSALEEYCRQHVSHPKVPMPRSPPLNTDKKSTKERLLTSPNMDGILRKSANMPCGNSGAS